MAKKSPRKKKKERSASSQPAARKPAPVHEMRWLEAVAGWVVAGLFLLSAVIVAPGIREAFPLPKLLISQTLGLLSLIVLLMRAVLEPGAAAASFRRARPAVIVAFPLLVAVVISSLTSSSRVHSFDALEAFAVGAACLLGWSALENPRRLLRWLLVPAALLSVIGLLQYTGLYSPFGFEASGARRLQMTSLAGSVGDLGTYLVLPLLIAQSWLRQKESGSAIFKGWAALVCLLCAAALVVSQTLAALVAAVVGSAVFWALVLPRRTTLRAGGLGSVALAVVVLAVGPLRSRVLAKLDQLVSGDLNLALSGRLDGWRVAVDEFLTDPLTGVGHGSYVAQFNESKLSLLEKGVPFYNQHRLLSTFGNAHNEFLEAAAEWGLVGLIALGWAAVVIVRQLRSLPAGEDRAFAYAGVSGLTVLCLAYFPFRLALTGFPIVLFLAWLLQARVSAEPSLAAEESADAGATKVSGASWLWRTAGLTLLALMMSVGLFSSTRRSLDRIAASRILFATESQAAALAASGQSTDFTGRLLNANLRALKRAAELDPAEVRIPMTIGGIYLLLNNERSAEQWYEECSRAGIAPRDLLQPWSCTPPHGGLRRGSRSVCTSDSSGSGATCGAS